MGDTSLVQILESIMMWITGPTGKLLCATALVGAGLYYLGGKSEEGKSYAKSIIIATFFIFGASYIVTSVLGIS